MDSMALHSLFGLNANFSFIWKDYFGPLGNNPAIFLFIFFVSSGKTPPMSAIWDWIDTRNVALDAPAQSTALEVPLIFLNGFCLTILLRLRLSLLLMHVFPHQISFPRLPTWTCVGTTLSEKVLLSLWTVVVFLTLGSCWSSGHLSVCNNILIHWMIRVFYCVACQSLIKGLKLN